MHVLRTLKEPLAVNRDAFVQREANKLAAGSRVLDVGAGPCKYRPLFKHCVYHAQDFAAHRPTDIGQLAEPTWSYGKLEYVCDAAAIPCPDKSYDAIVCTEVLEHVPHPKKVLTEIARLLRPGGVLILTAPLGSGLHQDPDHYFGGFTPYYYRRIFDELQLINVEIVPNGGFFSNHAQETQRFSAWIDPRRLPLLPALLMLPIYVGSLPWCRLIYPMIAPWLDKFDPHKGFAVGYHVTASKSMHGQKP